MYTYVVVTIVVVKDEDSVLVAVAVAVIGPVVITLPGADSPEVADKDPELDPVAAKPVED
jgi:hypothetical protein